MKKIVSLLVCIVMISSIFAFNVYSADENTEIDTSKMSLTVSKIIKDSDLSEPYTFSPFTLLAEFDNGAAEKVDRFVKKSWFRVDLLDSGADLSVAYSENKDKERIITDEPYLYANTYRTKFEMDVTLNGTYIFCAWSNINNAPDFIQRIDVTGIEKERPAAELKITSLGDYSKETVASAAIKNLECGKNAQVKRCVLVKSYLLPPGSWPESLAPEYCNQCYDEWVEKNLNSFVGEGLEVKPENEVYNLKEPGSYILFIEDTNGRYSTIWENTPTITDTDKTPEITAETVDSGDNFTTIKVNAQSDYGIAKFDYAVLGQHNIEPSTNGTDEYFLEKERRQINGSTITIDNTVVICAVDNVGKASYKRVEAAGAAEPSASPEPSSNPDDYLYEIKGLSILTQSGDKLAAPPQNASFMVEAEVNKQKDSDAKDYIFVAVYDKSGILLNIDYVKAKFTPNYDYSFGFNIPAQSSEIGSVKAFAWSDFNSMQPLAETKTLNFGE